ncbi:MAG: DUF1489 domain-containing protein [Alphaproteobacteria bacterium]|nr:DUF1489 domain-containing protein [Alphaproteobacteria bacterium]
MIKLCVGVENVEQMKEWQDRRIAERRADGHSQNPYHDTRTAPKRAAEMVAGGSIYWVIKHRILVRQRILRLESVEDADGKAMCRLHLDPGLVRTQPRGKRPFQGWRYLEPKAAPPDLDGTSAMPAADLETALKDALAW